MKPLPLEELARRLGNLTVAGAIVCVAFILALGGGITVEQLRSQHESHRNRTLIVRLQADEAKLADQQHAISDAVVRARIISCKDTNGVKRGAYDYIKLLTTRAIVTNEATLASPTTTAQQKAAARLSLAGVTAGLKAAADAFAVSDCTNIARSP